ncbi:MAG: glutamate racemase [Clostridiales bacterium]|nr:glutamate racemase [Clostridiales bacterium]
MDLRPIGVFDSGIGGISVLKELMAHLPQEDYIFYGDNKNAPYGVKDEGTIRQLATACVEHLIAQGVKAVVVACNTASSAAVEHLRERFSIPIIAMEPAIRPASKLRKDGKILVLATDATLRLKRYNHRMEELGIVDATISVPCPRFVELVEAGVTEGEVLTEAIAQALDAAKGEKVDVVVLGCTHFIHIKDAVCAAVQKRFTDAVVIDGNEGTTHQLMRVLEGRGLLNPTRKLGTVVLQSSGEEDIYIPIMERMLKGR